jgi:hypothetical protein
VCAILTFKPVDFYETLYEHYAISAYSSTTCFQVPTFWNKKKADTQTCEVGIRLYELWLGKAQPRPIANSIQANLKHICYHTQGKPDIECGASTSIQSQQKVLKADFLYVYASSKHHIFLTFLV